MHGAILPLPQHAFMACCSVKNSTEATLPLPYLFIHLFVYIGRYLLKRKNVSYKSGNPYMHNITYIRHSYIRWQRFWQTEETLTAWVTAFWQKTARVL